MPEHVGHRLFQLGFVRLRGQSLRGGAGPDQLFRPAVKHIYDQRPHGNFIYFPGLGSESVPFPVAAEVGVIRLQGLDVAGAAERGDDHIATGLNLSPALRGELGVDVPGDPLGPGTIGSLRANPGIGFVLGEIHSRVVIRLDAGEGQARHRHRRKYETERFSFHCSILDVRSRPFCARYLSEGKSCPESGNYFWIESSEIRK